MRFSSAIAFKFSLSFTPPATTLYEIARFYRLHYRATVMCNACRFFIPQGWRIKTRIERFMFSCRILYVGFLSVLLMDSRTIRLKSTLRHASIFNRFLRQNLAIDFGLNSKISLGRTEAAIQN